MGIQIRTEVRGSVGRPRTRSAVIRASRSSALIALRTARTLAARHNDTGENLRSYVVRPGREGFALSNPVKQAWFLEYGTKPHTILPKPPNKVLRFTGRDGAPVFARKVEHPGTRKSPIMRPAVHGNADRFEREFDREVMGELNRD